MNNTLFLLVVFFLGTSFFFAQDGKEIEVSFFNGKKRIDNVQYYVVKGNDAYLLEHKNGKIILDSQYLKEGLDELKLLAKIGNIKLEFFIKPETIFYLKISKLPISFKNFLKRMYVVNQGFDYEEIVQQSKKKYMFKE